VRDLDALLPSVVELRGVDTDRRSDRPGRGGDQALSPEPEVRPVRKRIQLDAIAAM
jgi:hypothetical protein